MVLFLSQCWRFAQYLLRPEVLGAVQGQPGTALAGAAKTLFWACVAVLAGLCLAQLRG